MTVGGPVKVENGKRGVSAKQLYRLCWDRVAIIALYKRQDCQARREPSLG